MINVLPSDSNPYYFSRLSELYKQIYSAMLSCMVSYSRSVRVPSQTMDVFSGIFNHILCDNPAVFYVKSFRLVTDKRSGICTFSPDYLYSRAEAMRLADKFRDFLGVFNPLRNANDFDKEIGIHDFCVKKLTYDTSFGPYSHSIIGPILKQSAVCDGLAKFIKLAFDYVGVRSLVVMGQANNPARANRVENHAWNIVRINKKNFHLDATFDMGVTKKQVRYDYFNLSDSWISIDHELPGGLPKCTVSGQDFYAIRNMTASSPSEFIAIIRKNLLQGVKTFVVKFTYLKYSPKTHDELLQIALNQYTRLFLSGVSLSVSMNTSQMVYEFCFT